MSRKVNDGITIDGQPSTKVQVHQMWQGKARRIVAEYESENQLLANHRPRMDRVEAVLVRRAGQSPRYLPIQEFMKELKERKKS